MPISKSDPIAIVGGGAFGLSTAYHLSLAGFINISVFEQDTQIPPRQSAANDLNKIVRAEYEDPWYTDLAIEAIAAWKKAPFAPYFHQTGFLHCVSGNAPDRAVATLKRFQAAAERHPLLFKHVVPIHGKDVIQDLAWQYNDAPLPGWQGYMNRFDGYAHSAGALAALYRVTQALGVRFFLGEQGTVSKIVYESTPQDRRGVGIKTKAGRFHEARLVIVAAGAAAGKIVPELGKQVTAKSWSVAHVHLTNEETSALRGIPVTYARDLGFFFEPDPETNLLKLCPMGGGIVNTDPATGVSQAPESLAESAFIPENDELQIRRLLAQTLPELSERPLVRKSLCWFADTKDSDFIIDFAPKTASSVLVLSGDSGHGFKMFPIMGTWVRELLESGADLQPVERWRWKSIESEPAETDWGGNVSWRLGDTQEFTRIRPPRESKL